MNKHDQNTPPHFAPVTMLPALGPQLDGMLEAAEEGERLRRIIRSSPWIWPGAEEATTGISVTASIGVAAYGMHGTKRNQLIEQADQAMYQAKLDGRDCARVAGA